MAIIVSADFVVGVDTALASYVPGTGTGFTLEASPAGALFVVTALTDDVIVDGTQSSSHVIYSSQPNPSVAEYDVQIQFNGIAVSGTDDPVFLVARYTDATNYYSAGTYQAAVAADKKIFKQVAGVRTELATGDSGIAINDVLKFEIRDATKKLYKNGVEQLSTTDNAITANGKAGFGMGNAWAVNLDDCSTTWLLDNYSVNEVAAAATTSLVRSPYSAAMRMLITR